MGLILLDQGKDPADFTDDDFDAALDELQKAVDSGQIRQVTGNDYTEDLAKRRHRGVHRPGPVTSIQLQADSADIKFVAARGRRHALVGQHADPDQGAAQDERRAC